MKKTWKERLRPPELPTKPRWWLTVGLLLLSALGLNALCLMIGTLNFSVQRFVTYLRYPLLLWLNFLPVVLFVALCYFLTNRAWLAFLIPAIPTLICAFINYFKVILRGDPFMVEDMFLLGEGVGSMSHYPIVLPLWFFVTVLLLVGGVIVLWRYARGRIPKRLWWVRVTGAVLCLALGAGAWFLWYSDRDLYRSQENYEAFNENKLAEDYAAHGFLYAFLHSVSDALFFEPENYSEAYAAQLLSAYEDVPIPNEQRLNIVVTMLESFSDLSRLPQIEQRLTADPYAPYHALLEECYHGTLISDTIGGGTTNAERAFLTGFTYPQPLFTGNTSSFVRYFNANGYHTAGAHPGDAWFYRRGDVNRRIGFGEYHYNDDLYKALLTPEHTYDTYADDALFFAERAQAYDDYMSGAPEQPCFFFNLSYQNHSPYNEESLDGREYLSHEGISDEAYYTVNNYLSSVADTCQQVSTFVDTFRDNPEPVLLVFFGDHKPTFGAGNRYYEEMGVNAEEASMVGCRNLYSTEYFFWANDAAKELLGFDFTGEGETISPCFLMAELFDCCGWEGSAWMQYQRQTRKTLPVIHRASIFSYQGVLTDDLPEDARRVYNEFCIVQYDLRNDLHKYNFAQNK